MNDRACTCGCCEGPVTVGTRPANRPGLSSLRFRLGSHDTFLATMLARLSASDLPALAALTTRAPDDPSIALLDAWATVADVLTFYQERIANEGYLATATERRSLVELGRLVGYEPRPGVSASVHLAYGLEPGHDLVIPAGTRAQSIPGRGELPQTFETSEPLSARGAWNALVVRQSQPQRLTLASRELWLVGTATRLSPGDLVVLEAPGPGDLKREAAFVTSVDADPVSDRTHVVLAGQAEAKVALHPKIDVLEESIAALSTPAPQPPGDPLLLRRDQSAALQPQAAGGLAFLASTRGIRLATLSQALHATPAVAPTSIRVYAMRLRTGLFGHNAPLKPKPDVVIEAVNEGPILPPGEWTWPDGGPTQVTLPEGAGVVYLDGAHKEVNARSFVALSPGLIAAAPEPGAAGDQHPDVDVINVESATTSSRLAYGMSGQTTIVELESDWIDFPAGGIPAVPWATAIRGTTVYAAPEELHLADQPVFDPVGPGEEIELELDDLYEGLEPGRLVVVAGERVDVAGVRASELALLAGVRVGVDERLPGDRLHTFVALAPPGLAHGYVRHTVEISANVVHATHGETRREVLGSGDAGATLQRFALKQQPLTYVSAPTATGTESTLQVRVDDVLWHEAPSGAALGPGDHGYVTSRGDDGTTAVTFGTGVRGARLPTGSENVRAVYRSGIGAAGNVDAGRITTATDRPLGVRNVTNPDDATGGADLETADSARVSIPLPLKALDRLVSVSDYADFSRTFAGIGKAAAAALTDGHRRVVHVTVAGANDVPLVEGDDVMVNLHRALTAFGDPIEPIVVARRELLVLVIRATAWLFPDYAWEVVQPQIRAALLDRFGFARQELGHGIAASSVVATMQSVTGVDGVELTAFDSIPETADVTALAGRSFELHDSVSVAGASWDRTAGLRPAQLAYLLPSVPDTLMVVPG